MSNICLYKQLDKIIKYILFILSDLLKVFNILFTKSIIEQKYIIRIYVKMERKSIDIFKILLK